MEKMTVALVGLGGFGVHYVKGLFGAGAQHDVRFVAGVDPFPDRSPALAEIQQRSIPIYPTLEAFRAAGRADLVVIASPLQLHCEQVIQAVEAGSHVLCEKPLGASPEQARQMIAARDRAGKIVAIGYQWSFAPTTQRLKSDIIAGRFGAPRRAATLIRWPRDGRYYARNNWAGRLKDDAGRLVLDSPANNACAHHLHHLLYLLGPTLQTSAEPGAVSAQLARANPISNYDTAAIRCVTSHGVELLFLASHAGAGNRGPLFRFEFDSATLLYDEGIDRHVRVRWANGDVEDYGELPLSDNMEKLWSTVEAIRRGQPTLCGLEAARAQTACMYAAQESVPEIVEFPKEIVQHERTGDNHRFIVTGLDELLDQCYAEFKMPAEVGASWARPGKVVHARSVGAAPIL